MSEKKCTIPAGRYYSTSFWGSAFWKTMHIASFQYIANAENKKTWRSFLTKWVPSSLPCSNCRKHYMKRLPTLKMTKILETRANLVRFLHELHNEINAEIAKKLGRSFQPLPFTLFCSMYKKHLKK